MTKPRVAIVLFNLGGPDRPESIRPFLVNLFTDPAILRVNPFLRPFLARIIARARVRPATENYARLGGRSPLLELTEQQARALEDALPDMDVRCFIAMRYWHPMSEETARAVAAWDPDEIMLLPLYPQYSTTTTGSSLTAWREAAAQVGLFKPTVSLCCYYADDDFIRAEAALVRRAWDAARAELGPDVPLRILFSAHGLPKIIIQEGDPYQFQVELSVSGVVQRLGIRGLDYVVCYQSRATPQEWLAPSTEDELERAGRDKVAVLVVPIAFVSEHSETLVELDVEYKELAEQVGVPHYFRAPTQNADPGFIKALAALVRRSLGFGNGTCSFVGGRTCAGHHRDCPFAQSDPRERLGVT
ncbi:Ferrochelatase [Rhodovastum atsumiense]|uniref:Ferrochelatase n=1 Tax=Rhodovastum atsumiense TaxID=504468 RepID=A0A5M6ILT5_9PROT|nr:ferrochelatase [Rhodovastum atsumiense]KAA5608819.1 ferrochelatase [Rhodovastum atsumiense]CAH2600832.1 Ferrochelatase [Rhodovastum atsumiense]